MKVARVVAFFLAVVVALAAIGLLVGGAALTWAHTTQRDADGFLLSPTYELKTDAYAIVSEDIDLASRPGDWWPGHLADVKVATTSSGELFVGIGPTIDVDTYLSGVGHDLVTELGVSSSDVAYRSVAGSAPLEIPAAQGFWVATSSGAAYQALTWDLAQGEWTVVVMNADGSAGVETATVVGANIGGVLLAVGIGLMIAGLFVGAAAAAALIWASRDRRYREEEAAMAPLPAGVYPAQLEGDLDPNLSRGLWLVKWFLAIPHFIVLAFLWVGFVFVTVFAFFAILFTGRYPRGAFDFNVGVLRWTWRVSFYATGAIGTDQYPPFTLADVDYPARFAVAYPESLSRGLALVKWWLLAIPHYLIIGVFTTGLIWWTTELDGNTAAQVGGGLIGLLVIVAGVALLFTGRYPQGLYDLILGLNRWVYRVTAYAGLMTDEYPPFRLDTGGSEPQPVMPPPPDPKGAPEREPVLTG